MPGRRSFLTGSAATTGLGAPPATGATRATVRGDDRVLLTTPVLTAATGPVPVDVDVRGVRVLRPEVTDANARTSFDRTSWVLARVTVG
ncbi:NPCBM/NEW2 domain-containing protein [Streptomyces sp. NPDC093089]|uniref:NPCBM/NEW2 domain-containing protein n=1 Tax=Streptomyces sp. NPDC093089 TaxID=3366024 RepID=UPI003813B678